MEVIRDNGGNCSYMPGSIFTSDSVSVSCGVFILSVVLCSSGGVIW